MTERIPFICPWRDEEPGPVPLGEVAPVLARPPWSPWPKWLTVALGTPQGNLVLFRLRLPEGP